MPELISIPTGKTTPRIGVLTRRSSTKLDNFIQPYRQYIASLVCCSDQLRDLTNSFPAMLFALTTDYGTREQRTECVRLINEGASLKDAAFALGLPLWLRSIPAGALRQPFGDLPDTVGFNLQIANHIPKTETEIRYWLRRILYAYQACDTEYALWMARQKRFPYRDRASEPHTLMAAWAWFSTQTDLRGQQLLRKPWSPKMSIKKAYDEARAWEHRLRLAERLGNGLLDTWFYGGMIGRYEFVPLVTVDDFLTEARIMGNCLDQYGDQVTYENARVFSMRLAGRHVADVEVGFHDDDPTMPMIEQIKGPKNKRASPEIWQAAYMWLGSQKFRPMKEGVQGGKEIGKKIKAAIWRPYLDQISDPRLRNRVEIYAFGPHVERLERLREIFEGTTD